MNGDQLRNRNIVRQSVNPFGKNYPSTVQATSTKNKVVGFKQGDQLHHNAIVDVYAPFFIGNKAEDLAMVDHLQQLGVYVGNNDKNFTPITGEKLHQGGIHNYAIENGIQKGKANHEDVQETIYSLRENISKLPYKERAEAATIFAQQVQPALEDEMRRMGFKRPSAADRRAEWKVNVDKEHNKVIAEYGRNIAERELKQELAKRGLATKISTDRRALDAIDVLMESLI